MSTNTREVAKQQEQEEQLTKLVSHIESQIKRLDEVAEEQNRQGGIDGGAAGDCSPTAGSLVGDNEGQLYLMMSKQIKQ